MNKIIFVFLIAFSSVAEAKSLFQDPNRNDFNAALHSYKKADIACLPNCKVDNDKKKFIIAFLHILKNNNNKLGIVHSCSLGIRKLQAMSKSKINDASYELSKLYYYGVCVPANIKKSESLLKKAADNKYVPAQRFLGVAYGRKDVQPKLYRQDYRQSLNWLLKAAKAGDGKSAAMVSTYFKKGLGVEVNERMSYEWAVKTINSKYPVELGGYYWRLAGYYETGYGTQKNLIQAYKYYDLSGSAGGEGKSRISQDMTDAQIQEAIQQSRAWQEEHKTFVPSYYGHQHQADGSYR